MYVGNLYVCRSSDIYKHSDGESVGVVTSGTWSPTLEEPIALAYVPPALARVGTELNVQIRGRTETATVVRRPFYRRS